MSSSKIITLTTNDDVAFDVDEAVAFESQTIKDAFGDGRADNGTLLPNVSSKILSKVIEYCNMHVEARKFEERSGFDEELKAWDADFVKVDQGTLFGLVEVSFPILISNSCF